MRTKETTVPARGKLWVKRLALLFGSFALCLILFEVILRSNGYGKLEIYQPDPKLYWRLKPNQDCFTKVDRRPVHINSHGTRGPEFAAKKPASVIRILSLGDSRTFGWGLADEETYSRRLETLLREHANGRHTIEVINAGVNAWSFPQMQVFFRDVALAWSPDFVILAEANLWTQFSEKNSNEFVKKFMSRVRLKNLLRRSAIYHFAIEVKLQAFYTRYRTKFIPVDPEQDTLFKEQQQRDPDAVFRSAIEDLCVTARANGVTPVLLFLPTLGESSAANDNRVRKAKLAASEKFHVPLVDVTHDLAAGGKAFYLEADPVHLNAQGNERVAFALLQCLTNQLGP